MKKTASMAVLVITVFAFATSCSGKDGKEEGKVLAEINGTKITEKEFNEKVSQIPGMSAHGGLDAAAKKQLLDNLITRELIVQEAAKRGIDKDEEIQQRLKDLRERIVLDKFLQKEVEEKVTVTAEDVKAYYDQHPDEMKENEEVHAAHILVKTKEEAEAALKKLKKGANFSELAQQLSLDPGSKNRGGDLGFFPRGRMVPAFEEAAFKLKPGELSEPIQTQYGFHVIKLMDRRGGQPLSLEAAQPMLQQKLMQEKQKTTFESLIADLKAKAKITVHEELLTTETPAAPAPAPEPEQK